MHPFDFAATAQEPAATLRSYAGAAGDNSFDFGPAIAEAEALREDLYGSARRPKPLETQRSGTRGSKRPTRRCGVLPASSCQ